MSEPIAAIASRVCVCVWEQGLDVPPSRTTGTRPPFACGSLRFLSGLRCGRLLLVSFGLFPREACQSICVSGCASAIALFPPPAVVGRSRTYILSLSGLSSALLFLPAIASMACDPCAMTGGVGRTSSSVWIPAEFWAAWEAGQSWTYRTAPNVLYSPCSQRRYERV